MKPNELSRQLRLEESAYLEHRAACLSCLIAAGLATVFCERGEPSKGGNSSDA